VCPQKSILSERAGRSGITVKDVAMRSILDLASIKQLNAIIRKNNIDIVHMHTYKGHFLGAVASYLSGVKVKLVTRRMDFPISNNVMNRLLYGVLVDKVISISDSVRKEVQKVLPKGKDSEVIHSCVVTVEFDPLARRENIKLKTKNKNFVIGTVSNLVKRKGIKHLIIAFGKMLNEYPNLKLLIIGDGPLRTDLELLVRELNLASHVKFKGFVEDVKSYLLDMDIFVLPSLEEALGLAIIEAMAMSLPVVASKIGGIPEVVEDGTTGLLVDPGNPEELSCAMRYLLSNPELLRAMGENGRKRSEQCFNNDILISKYEQVYRELIDG
jgi:glycosyltransferase involved in cell wall biosynthesis